MVETTLDIRFFADEEDCDIESTVEGETEQQAELVAFGHFVARMVSLLGPARAGAVVDVLLGRPGTAVPVPPGADASSCRALVRFIDGPRGPRIYFRLKTKGTLYGDESIGLLRDALLARHPADPAFARRFALTCELLGRLAATGQISAENEFDVALAAADVGWRRGADEADAASPLELECPACGNTGADGFELRVWPSQDASLHRCGGCGAGVWRRGGNGARLIRADIWAAMESTRHELAGTAPGGDGAASGSLLDQLKRVFVENGWPYAEVTGAPVLVSELEGPEGRWDFYAQAVEDKHLVLLYSISRDRVPEERRREVSDFLTRANYGLADGNFELDFEDGEVRYKTAVHVPGDQLDGLLVRRLVRSNGLALETYLPSIGSVIAAGTITR